MKRCRHPARKIRVTAIDFAGHQSYRNGLCRCGVRVQQQLTWSGKPEGPWRVDAMPLCTHGENGAKVPACMSCAVDRQNRGLR